MDMGLGHGYWDEGNWIRRWRRRNVQDMDVGMEVGWRKGMWGWNDLGMGNGYIGVCGCGECGCGECAGQGSRCEGCGFVRSGCRR